MNGEFTGYRPEPQLLDLHLPTSDGERIAVEVRFLTPTLLKDRGTWVADGARAFGPLIRRARDRISALYQLYADAPVDQDLPWDFRRLGAEADAATCSGSTTRWTSQDRRSTRTGQTHRLGGLEGPTIYDGVTASHYRLLKLAETVHVGKYATFGLGRIRVRKIS